MDPNLPSSFQILVSEAAIRQGRHGSCCHCPIALSLEGTMVGDYVIRSASVRLGDISLALSLVDCPPEDPRPRWLDLDAIPTPPEGREFLARWDARDATACRMDLDLSKAKAVRGSFFAQP